MDDTALDAIRERHGRAMRGPWKARCINATERPFAVITPHGSHGDEIVCGSIYTEHEAALLAHSWQDIRDLLEEVDRLRKALVDIPVLVDAGRQLAEHHKPGEPSGTARLRYPTGDDHAR